MLKSISVLILALSFSAAASIPLGIKARSAKVETIQKDLELILAKAKLPSNSIAFTVKHSEQSDSLALSRLESKLLFNWPTTLASTPDCLLARHCNNKIVINLYL